MVLTLWEGLAMLGYKTWPVVPSVGQAVTYEGKLYRVSFVTHDMDTHGKIDVVLERI